MTNFLPTTNIGCVKSMWVFMGIIPLSLLYLINLFRKIEFWHKLWTFVCLVLRIMHHNICKFSTSIGKLSLIAKKTPKYWTLTMLLSSFSLGMYNCKLSILALVESIAIIEEWVVKPAHAHFQHLKLVVWADFLQHPILTKHLLQPLH